MKRKTKYLFYPLAVIIMSLFVIFGCSDDGNDLGFENGDFECGSAITFIYHGEQVSYGTIKRGGICWMDRNLGAEPLPFVPVEDATGNTDERLHGHLFQWGRLDDGHQNRTSGTTSNLSNTDDPGHGNFITVDGSPYDWRSPPNDNLWQGEDGINNPCPPGWRLPTERELIDEFQIWGSFNAAGAFGSALMWPAGGYRRCYGGLDRVGSEGYIWGYGGDHYHTALFFSNNDVDIGCFDRCFGASVRCVKTIE